MTTKQEPKMKREKAATGNHYWVSCDKFTVAVQITNGIILDAPPIVKKLTGQRLESLVGWAKSRFGSVRVELLGTRSA